MKEVVLSKKVGWISIIVLLALDFLIDIKGGGRGHLIWQPVMDFFGTNNIYYLTPLILLAFYLIVKIGVWSGKTIDKINHVSTIGQLEELVLTTIVIIYTLHNIWLFSVNFLGFKLITTENHYYLIPIFIIIGTTYAWWAEKKLKNKK